MFFSKRNLNRVVLGTVAVVAMATSSCAVPKDRSYFQDLTSNSKVVPAEVLDIKVRTEDKLRIVVSTQDKELSELFNLNTQAANSMGGKQTGMMYTVDPNGCINFPVLGEVKVLGLRRYEVASHIENLLKQKALVKDPIVTVEFGNTYFTTLGEIGGKVIEFNYDRLNIVDAIAMAGGIPATGRMDNVMVLRETEGGRRDVYFVNFTDMNTLEKSPVYYVQQRDIIYVEPTNYAKRNTTPLGNSVLTPGFWFSMVSMVFGLGTMIVTLAK